MPSVLASIALFALSAQAAIDIGIPTAAAPAMTDSSKQQHILVTGGSGYIGSHTCLALLNAGFRCTVVDSLINSSEESIRRVRDMTSCGDRLVFVKADLCDEAALEEVFQTHGKFDACIHFAGLKAVGESVQQPLMYYANNLGSTINLLRLMDKHGCHRVVFSSSATVYGSAQVPITEQSPVGTGITNAYGRTKYMIEEILRDFKASKAEAITKQPDDWSVSILRYFNPVGAHPSGMIGEDPNGPPNNLMPYVAQVAVGRRPHLTVFGNDYDTPDGTGVRDYIHVMDLAEGHVAALRHMDSVGPGYEVFNLGTGRGYSVLEMVEAMRKASGQPIPYQVGPRREGDIAVCYADTEKAERVLGWRAKLGLVDMCADLWAWQSKNPQGYAGSA